MRETNINGCNTGSYSSNNKMLEEEAYTIPQSINIETQTQMPHIGVSMEEATNAIKKAMQSVGCGSS